MTTKNYKLKNLSVKPREKNFDEKEVLIPKLRNTVYEVTQ